MCEPRSISCRDGCTTVRKIDTKEAPLLYICMRLSSKGFHNLTPGPAATADLDMLLQLSGVRSAGKQAKKTMRGP